MKNLRQGLYINDANFNIPENAYTFALNSVYSSNIVDGELMDEKGNRFITDLPENSSILGHVNLLNDEVILFSQNNTYFYISHLIKDNLTILIKTDCFNYDFKNPIKGVLKTYNSCERIVYFYDGVEPDRFVNIDKLSVHLDNAGGPICKSFLIKPEFRYPKIEVLDILNYGGKLKSGSYEIFIRYLDEMNNTTDWLLPSEDVHIYFDNYQDNYNLIQGSDKETNKAIKYKISNLDVDYKYFEVAIAINKSETYLYQKYVIDSNEKDITVTNTDNKPFLTYLELLTPTSKYKNSKAVVNINNRLVRANLTESKIDWGYVQREYANKVKTYFQAVENVESDKTIEYNQNKSLMRDEIYALALVYVLADGSFSPALHIPGRPLDEDFDGNVLDLTDVSWHIRPLSTTDWDSEIFTTNDDSSYIVGDFPKWKVYNTAKIDDYISGVGYRGYCGYFEPQDSDNNPILYPEVYDCLGELIYPNDNGGMMPIRHHRMPDTTLIRHFDSNGPIRLQLEFDNIVLPTEYPEIVGYFVSHSDRKFGKTVLDKGLMSSIIQRQYNDFVTDNDVSPTEAKRVSILHQSLPSSMDNNSPKSYTIQTSENINFPGFGGDQTFVCIPACSENIQYAKENSEETEDGGFNTHTHVSLAGFDSPKSKILQKTDFATYFKYEVQMLTDTTDDKKIYRNRRKFKTRSKDRIIETQTDINFNTFWRPETTSRKLKRTFFVPADRNYFHVGYDQAFVNKTQQEIGVIDLDAPIVTPTRTKDEDSNFPNTGLNTDKLWWCNPSSYTRATQWWVDNSLDWVSDYPWKMALNYISLKNYIPDLHSNLDQIRYIINSEYDTPVLTGDTWISKFNFRKTFYGYIPHSGNWTNPLNGVGRIWSKNTVDEDTDPIGDYPGSLDDRYNSIWGISTDSKFTMRQI